MVIAFFRPNNTYPDDYPVLWQYDYGQILRIQGLTLPSAVEIHFSLQDKDGDSVTRIGVTKDGITDVVIPDSMLQNRNIKRDYNIYAFVYLTNANSGQTEYKITISVKSRPEPEAFNRPEDAELFKEAILAVNESAARSEESEKQAEGWTHGRKDLPERAQDNAKYYSDKAREDSMKTDADRKRVERLVESVSGVDEQVAKVEGLTKSVQTYAANAACSEKAAKESEINAELVAQKTAQDFTLTAQQILANVSDVGQAQTERVQTVGDTAIESVKTAQEIATEAVEIIKTEAVKTVQTVTQEIIADRAQINENKEGVAKLKEEITDIFLCSYQFVATDESGGYAYNIKKINIPKGTQLRFYGTGGNGNVLATSSNGNAIVTKLSDGEVKDVTLEYDVTGLGFYINKPATVNVRVYGKSLSAILDYTNNNVAKVKNNLEKLYTVGYSFDKAVDGQYQYGMVKVDIKQGSKIKILVEGNTCNILAVTKSGNVVLVSGVSDGNIYDVDVTSDITQLGYYAFSDGRTKITIFGEYLVKFIEKANPYNNVKGKKVLFLGDSITHFDLNDNGWCKYFNQIVNPSKSVNVAVSGATWLDKSETVLNGNPSTYESVNNTISNQVEKIVRGKDSTHSNYVHVEDYDEFDIIIIACGTNDSTDGFTTATDDERYNSCYNKFGVRLDVDSLNRKIIDGATMYAYEKLHALYPNAVFFYCTPIQCYPSKKTRYENENKGNILKDIGRKLSITVIDSILCGINGNHEQYNSEGTDLADGLHPNARGAKKLGLYNAREVVKYFSVELPK